MILTDEMIREFGFKCVSGEGKNLNYKMGIGMSFTIELRGCGEDKWLIKKSPSDNHEYKEISTLYHLLVYMFDVGKECGKQMERARLSKKLGLSED